MPKRKIAGQECVKPEKLKINCMKVMENCLKQKTDSWNKTHMKLNNIKWNRNTSCILVTIKIR